MELNAEVLLEHLIDDYSTLKNNVIRNLRNEKITQEVFSQDVKGHIDKYYREFAPKDAEDALILFQQYILGYSRLTPLIEDLEITDIRCISFENINYKKNGERMQSDIKFGSKKEYRNFIDFVATRNHVNISHMSAIQRFTDYQSSEDFILRFTVTMPLVNTYDEPYLCIRKIPKNFPEMDELVEKGMLSKELAGELVKRFRKGSTLICGGNSSGKTTILNALKETLPEDVAVMVAQQADELTAKRHPNMMFMHSLPGSGETLVSYELDKISIAALTMDVDFFILGEIKGDEAIYVLNAAYTGQLCAATIHAPSADKGVDKMVDYSMHRSRYERKELMQMFASCFDTVVFMKKYKVNQVYEMKGWDVEHEKIIYAPIYQRGDEDDDTDS